MSNLTTYKAFCDTYIKPCPPPKILKPRSRVEVKVKDIAWYLYWSFSLALQVSEHPPPSHFNLVSIPFQWISWKDGQARHLSNSTKVSQVSNTTGTPLDSILFHRFEAWSHRPPCQAPGLDSFLANFIAFQVDVRQSLVDFQCFGKGLWTKTMANNVKPENLQGDLRHWHRAMSTTKNLEPRSRVEVQVNFRQNKILLDWYLYWNFSLALQVSEHPPPSHFHLVSIPFQWLSWKDGQARHLSNSTKVSQVSNTTGNPVLGKWGFGFCNWGLTFGLGLEDSLFNSSTRGTFSCLIFEQNTFLEIG